MLAVQEFLLRVGNGEQGTGSIAVFSSSVNFQLHTEVSIASSVKDRGRLVVIVVDRLAVLSSMVAVSANIVIVIVDVGLINTQQAAALRAVEVVCIAAVLTQVAVAITGVVRGPDPLAAVGTDDGVFFQTIRAE